MLCCTALCYAVLCWKTLSNISQTHDFKHTLTKLSQALTNLLLKADAKFLWLHDLLSDEAFPPEFASMVSSIFTQSDFHSRSLAPHIQPSIRVLPNGIDRLYTDSDTHTLYPGTCGSETCATSSKVTSPAEAESEATAESASPNSQFDPLRAPLRAKQFQFQPQNSNDVFVYASAPNRGLEALLRQWPRIRAALPTATLEVYYTALNTSSASSSTAAASSDQSFYESSQHDENLRRMFPGLDPKVFEAWLATLRSLVQQPGVRALGTASHAVMARAYARAGYLLYPTNFPETGCITVMKAMASGAIPITTRYTGSVLYELTSRFDLGPSQPLRPPTQHKTAQKQEQHNAAQDWTSGSEPNLGREPSSQNRYAPDEDAHAYEADLDYQTYVETLWTQSVLEAIRYAKPWTVLKSKL